jgi:hypothetical protein
MSEVETESGTVTFVNGRAESQTTEGEGSGTPEGERAAAIAAVKEALKGEAAKAGEDAAKEARSAREQDPLRPRGDTTRDANGKFVAKPADPDAHEKPIKNDADEDATALKRVLQERKQIAATKAAQQAEFSKMQQQLQAYERHLQQQRAEIERDRKRYEVIKTDPVRAFRENGWDPESVILDLARDGTPEGQAMRQQRELQAQLKEMQDWKAAQEAQRVEAQRQHEARQWDQRRAQIEQEFVSTALNEDKHPHLTAFYKGHEASLVAEGDSVADQYRALTGKEATSTEIAEYLEDRAAKWYKTMSSRSQAPSAAGQQNRPVVTQGRPTQGSATGRTLSADDSSERRSLGASFKDLDGDERLAAAREAVGAALRSSGER